MYNKYNKKALKNDCFYSVISKNNGKRESIL